MPRRKLIRQNKFPYHVFIRSNNKDWFKVPLFKMWDICYECLLYALDKTPIKIHCFVLMSNHYHLLVSTPGSDLDKFMEHFNKRLSQLIKRDTGAENHKFANRYKWTIIDSKSYLLNIYRYIYQNPVRVNLCDLCIDYPYSSLRFSPMQLRKLGISVHIDYFKNRGWMEYRNGSEFDSTINTLLRRSVFTPGRDVRVHIKNKLDEIPC